MRVKEFSIVALLIVALSIGALSGSAAAFTIPSLLGRPLMPTLAAPAILDTTDMPTAADVASQAAAGTFTLTVSGNVYVDKLPVNGAVVTVYLNGRQVGQSTAGDIYQFSVPGARIGDTVRVDASYQGYTGSATDKVKFKTMNLNVQVTTGHSFIRDALEMLPTKDSLSDAQTQQQASPNTATPSTSGTSTPSTSTPSTTTSTADANKLTQQIWGDTSKMLGNTLGQTQNIFGVQPSTSTVDTGTAAPVSTGSSLSPTNLNDALQIAGLTGLPV